MVQWKTLDFKQKAILVCGIILIVFPFIPWWIHPYYNAFWIPLIGMYVGSPFNNFRPTNFLYYLFAAITLFGGVLCCLEQKNHKWALYGAIIATVASFTFMCIFIAGTSDLNRPYYYLDLLIADANGKGDTALTLQYLAYKISIEIVAYLEMLQGNIIPLSYATKYYLGSLPILFGALAAIVAW